MTKATIGKRYQVVIPQKERQKLNIKPSSKVEIEVEGERLVIYPLSTSRLRGIGIELNNGTDATAYVKKLRAEWDQRP